jgi:hypothetical protein
LIILKVIKGASTLGRLFDRPVVVGDKNSASCELIVNRSIKENNGSLYRAVMVIRTICLNVK